MRGTNSITPLATPNTLTPNVHRQSFGVDACVVAEHVDRAVRAVCLVRKVTNRLGIGHIGHDTGQVVTAFAELTDRLVERGLLDVGQHEPHPFC
jgi:hypothetical protein